MKRSLPVFLVAIVFYNLLGYFFLFATLELQAKYHAKQLIRNSATVTSFTRISLSKSSLASGQAGFSAVNDHEFSWKGKMLDVMKKVETADSIFYYCYEDKDETALISNFLQYIAQQSSATQNNNTSKFSLKNLVQFYFQEPDATMVYLPAHLLKSSNFLSLSSSGNRRLFTPPPDEC